MGLPGQAVSPFMEALDHVGCDCAQVVGLKMNWFTCHMDSEDSQNCTDADHFGSSITGAENLQKKYAEPPQTLSFNQRCFVQQVVPENSNAFPTKT